MKPKVVYYGAAAAAILKLYMRSLCFYCIVLLHKACIAMRNKVYRHYSAPRVA